MTDTDIVGHSFFEALLPLVIVRKSPSSFTLIRCPILAIHVLRNLVWDVKVHKKKKTCF